MATTPTRHPHHRLHLRKDHDVNHSIDLAIRVAHERQAREREIRALRALSVSAERASIRQRIGETLIRFGERLASPDPAWSR